MASSACLLSLNTLFSTGQQLVFAEMIQEDLSEWGDEYLVVTEYKQTKCFILKAGETEYSGPFSSEYPSRMLNFTYCT